MKNKNSKDIYSNEFVGNLFDSIASTYDKVNAVTSFGFSKMWRKKFISEISIHPGDQVIDLMCGMGECWPCILKQQKDIAHIKGIDLSSEMIKHAEKKFKNRKQNHQINIYCHDVFTFPMEAASADVIIAGFGLKTLSEENVYKMASLLMTVLKPGGRFSFIEMSVPSNAFIRATYMFYLKKVLPFVGRLFLGNPENYRMLGLYTSNFKDCNQVAKIFESVGLQVQIRSYFYGCSSSISGLKHIQSS